MLVFIFVIINIFDFVFSQNDNQKLKFLILSQNNEEISYINNYKLDFIEYKYNVAENNIMTKAELCTYYEQGHNIILDLTWNNRYTQEIRKNAENMNIIYLKLDLTIASSIKVIDSYLHARNASDVTFIFENSESVDQASIYWFDRSSLRKIIINGMIENSLENLNYTQFMPSFYVFVAETSNMINMLTRLQTTKVFRFPERLVLFFLDFPNLHEIKDALFGRAVSLITYDQKMCCMNKENCVTCPDNYNINQNFLDKTFLDINQVFNDLSKNEKDSNQSTTNYNCSSPIEFSTKLFYQKIKERQQNIYEMDGNNILKPTLEAIIEIPNKRGNFETIGKYNHKDGFILESGKELKPNKKFYRVGTGIATPWIYREKDPETNLTRLSGYCIDFIDKLAEVLNFDYELGVTDGNYGVKFKNGSWDGLVGGLIDGNIDIVVAPMTMTAEREEAVDFVTPIFATTGITIVTRKPIRKSSLFKFLKVLGFEVWLTIIGALLSTALVLYILNRFSPFSSRNTKYNQECRVFDLKECVWFAITSFTPQGGGEAPMNLSGRILVGTYWIFVVLMIATFTANLSTFLTVERMELQLPSDYSLEQLVRQSRINFTVIKNSWPHAYFKNMRNTENDIYDIWKDLSLNKTTDRYRVWDFPIKEQYDKVIKAISETIPVENVSEGYRMVLEHTDGDFAFIHDYSEVRYAIARTCYLVEVGKPFAERPYALAVQQGSELFHTIGKAILDLQQDGYFEELRNKYWKDNLRGECPDDETSEGIEVDSLGGVFIATIFLLIISILTLIWETLNIKNIFKNKVETINKESINKKKDKLETNFKNRNIENFDTNTKKEISTISENTAAIGENVFGPRNRYLHKFDNTSNTVSLGNNFRPVVGHNYRDTRWSVVRGNYILVKGRRPIHFDKDGLEIQPYMP